MIFTYFYKAFLWDYCPKPLPENTSKQQAIVGDSFFATCLKSCLNFLESPIWRQPLTMLVLLRFITVVKGDRDITPADMVYGALTKTRDGT